MLHVAYVLFVTYFLQQRVTTLVAKSDFEALLKFPRRRKIFLIAMVIIN